MVRRVVVRHHRRERAMGASAAAAAAAVFYCQWYILSSLFRADECDDSFSSFCAYNTCQMYIIRIAMNSNHKIHLPVKQKKEEFSYSSMFDGGQRHRRLYL